jgi:chromosome segregation protein
MLRTMATTPKGPSTVPSASTMLPDLDAVLAAFDELLEDLRTIDRLEDLPSAVERLAAIHARIGDVRKRCAPDAPKGPPPELRGAEDALRGIEMKLTDVQQRMTALHEEERRKKGAFFDLQRSYREQQLCLNDVTARANDLRIELARLEQRREDLRTEIGRDLGSDAAPDTLPRDTAAPPDAEHRIDYLRRELTLIGTLDDQTMAEYRDTEERATFLAHQTADLRASIGTLEEVIVELEREIERAFHIAFTTINAHFERYFRQLFGGGVAKLILLREEPVANEDENQNEDVNIPDIPPTDHKLSIINSQLSILSGIDIQATPPGKRIKHIAMLSGGERALVAIALLCAIISSSQSPFVILDEVDAALDESNSVRFAEILKDLSAHTQFVVVTHNRYSMERAAMIYGITMGDDGASKLLSLKLEEAANMHAGAKVPV